MKKDMNLIGLSHQKGLSMIELMVAVALGLILISGLMQVFTNLMGSYRIQDAVIRMQENGEFAMLFISKDIRSADFWGCMSSLASIDNQINTAGAGYNTTYYGFKTAIEGTANSSGAGGVLAGTDTITLRGTQTSNSSTPVKSPYGPTASSPLTIASGSGIQAGDVLLVGDCKDANIFQASSVTATSISHAANSGSPGNFTGAFNRVYRGDAQVYSTYVHTFSVRNGTNNIPTLFLTNTSGSQELVQGVENMVIFYGEDLNDDGSADRYVRADSVSDMDKVVSIRVSLLLQTLEDNLSPTAISYSFNGQTITPTDKKMRRVYTGTFLLRNRSN